MFPRVFLNPSEEIEVAQGFPWVFDNEISHVKFEEKSGVKQASLADCSVKDGEVEMVAATVLKNTQHAGVLRNIKIA